jgi:hypothetical protein
MFIFVKSLIDARSGLTSFATGFGSCGAPCENRSVEVSAFGTNARKVASWAIRGYILS